MILNKLSSREQFAAITGVFVVFALVMLPVKNGYILRWYDEMSLFMTGDIFLDRMTRYPGGILQYIGTWLTQLMYYPWLGSCVLIALWLLLTLLCDRTWKLREGMRGLTLLPAMFLLASVLVLDEAWVSLNYTGYLFAPTLGAICAVAIAFAASLISRRMLRYAFLILCTLLYMPLGFYALLGVFIAALTDVRNCAKDERRQLYIALPVTIAAILIAPQLYYFLYTGMGGDRATLYVQGLPGLMMERYDLYLWTPFIGMTIALCALPFFQGNTPAVDTPVKKPSKRPAAVRKSLPSTVVTVSLLFITGWYTVAAGQKSEQFRATVLMMQNIDTLRWDKIAYIMNRIKEPPSFTMKIIGNLAAVKLGGGTGEVTYTPAEEQDPRHNEEFLMTAFVNVPVYYHIGNTHGSYRWAMEHTIKYGTRAFFIKYLVRNAIVHGEYELAARYNRLLLNTMFHRKWASHFQRYIDNPDLIKDSAEFNSIPENPAGNSFV